MRGLSFWAAYCLFFAAACIPLEKKTPEPENKPEDFIWKKADAINSTDSEVRALYATPYELFAASNSYLYRLDDKLNLLEKRLLSPTDRAPYSRVAFSDNLFARLYNDGQKELVEFRLTKNGQPVRRFKEDNLVDLSKSEGFSPFKSVLDMPGCFSTDGTKYLLHGQFSPGSKPYVIILDIQLNFAADDFIFAKVSKKLELPNYVNTIKFESCRFLEGNFYLATPAGGYRITPDGQVKKLFSNWVRDFFAVGDKIYTTGVGDFDFQRSTDNGLTWRRTTVSETKFVKFLNGKLISQKQVKEPFGIADSSMAKVVPLKYNPNMNFTTAAALAYSYDMTFYKGFYFMNLGNEVYYSKELKAK